MTWAPVDFLAIHFDRAREMNEPPMPNRPAMTSSPMVVLESRPRMVMTKPSRMSIARFVARNKPIRIIIVLHDRHVSRQLLAGKGMFIAIPQGVFVIRQIIITIAFAKTSDNGLKYPERTGPAALPLAARALFAAASLKKPLLRPPGRPQPGSFSRMACNLQGAFP